MFIRRLTHSISNIFASTLISIFNQVCNRGLTFSQLEEPRNQSNHADDGYFRNIFKNYFDEKRSFITWMTDEDVVGIESVLKITVYFS